MKKEHREFGYLLDNEKFCEAVDKNFEFKPIDNKFNVIIDILKDYDVGICGSYVLNSFDIIDREIGDLDVISYKDINDDRFKQNELSIKKYNIINTVKKVVLQKKRFNYHTIHFYKNLYFDDLKIDFLVKDKKYFNDNTFEYDNIKYFKLSDCIKANYRMYYNLSKYYFLYPIADNLYRYYKGFNDCETFINKTKNINI